MDRTITLENVRTASDVTMPTRLKDGGVAIDWTTLTDIKAWLFSDAQKAIAGRCDVSINQADSNLLVCEYSASKPQYLGVNRLIVQAKYQGRTKTYDVPVFNFVSRTAAATGTVTIDDPVVDVEIVVEDVSSSILDNIIAAALDAAARAEAAAQEAEHMVDIHTGPEGKSAYEVAVAEGYTGTEEEWLASLVGPQGLSAYQLAVQEGYEGTLSEWLASLKGPAGDSAYQVAVEEGFVGTKAQWLASLVGPQGLSAYQVAVVEGFEGSVSDWLASLVGPVGPPGVTSVLVTVDNTSGTPAATATLVNGVLTIAITGIKGIQGNTGSSVAFPFELVNNRTTNDPTKGLSAAEGYRLGQDLSALLPATVPDGFFLADELLNVVMKYTADGFDAAKVSAHFVQALLEAGFFGDSFVNTNEDGFAVVDENLNIGFIVDNDGARAKNIYKAEIINE